MAEIVPPGSDVPDLDPPRRETWGTAEIHVEEWLPPILGIEGTP